MLASRKDSRGGRPPSQESFLSPPVVKSIFRTFDVEPVPNFAAMELWRGLGGSADQDSRVLGCDAFEFPLSGRDYSNLIATM
jgi:hypothetical protein